MANGGNGGAWKVAYADFVTAMMALFMVLWISAQDKKILISTSQYFQNPFRSAVDERSGIMPFNRELRPSPNSAGQEPSPRDAMANNQLAKRAVLNSVAAEINRLFSLEQAGDRAPLEVQMTSDGLRLVLYNRPQKPVFEGKTAELTDWGKFLLQSLAWVVDRHRFTVAIDGHTQAGLPLTAAYSAWDLSADRANAARRALVFYAVDPDRIERVSGLADTQPLEGTSGSSELNQRVTVSLRLAAPSKLTPTPPETGRALPAAAVVPENQKNETIPPRP